MERRISVKLEGKTYTWDGSNWYEATTFLIPSSSVTFRLNSILIQKEKSLDVSRRSSKTTSKSNIHLKRDGSIKFINKHGIDYLYHMTSIHNLESILRLGLLSHNESHRRKLIARDVSDSEVQDIRSQIFVLNIPLQDYVCLYFSPRNPMLYRLYCDNIQNEIIILGIAPCVLLNQSTVFTDGNAAVRGRTSFYTNVHDLELLPWEIIKDDYWTNHPDGKRIKCAEVLVYPLIESRYIMKVFSEPLHA